MNSVRVKLTLWYTSVLGLVLVLFSVGVYVLMGNRPHDRLDRGLQTAMEGTVRLFSHGEYAELLLGYGLLAEGSDIPEPVKFNRLVIGLTLKTQ
jgi:hypothetical protein